MIDHNLIISLKTPEASGSGLKFRKEVIYVGTFYAPTPEGGRQKFDVSENDLKHWKESVDVQLSRGILIDVPIGHTTEPEKSRGKVVGAEVTKNAQGHPALFLDIEFADQAAAKLAKTTQVSLFSPPAWTDGLGNTYSRPIRHVALTQQPVIPNLGAFALIASLDEGTNSMEFLTQIAEAIGLEVDPAMDEAALTQAILDAITSEEGVEDEEMPDDEMPSDEMPDDEMLSEDGEMDEEEEEDTALSLSMRREIAGGRKARIKLLLSERRITPAQAKALEAKYCVPAALSLSMTTSFDSAVDLLALSEPRKTGSRTGLQVRADYTNPLLADATARGSK